MNPLKYYWRLFAQATTVFAAAAFVATVFWQLGAKPLSYRDAVSKALPSVVSIYGRDAHGSETNIGAGVIISDHGHILTNYHLIANIGTIEVGLQGGDTHVANLIGIDPSIDIAVLRIAAADLPAIGAAADNTLEPGDVVFAIGNPFGLKRSTTMGIVSAIGRDRLGLHGFERFIQTDAAINPGSSGGALANANGNLVGINSALFYRHHGIRPQGIGFAIPVGLVMRSYQQLIDSTPPTDNPLGAEIRNLSPRLRSEVLGTRWTPHTPVLATKIWPNTPAQQNGMKTGDIILSINNTAPHRHTENGTLQPSTKTIELLRNKQELQIDLTAKTNLK